MKRGGLLEFTLWLGVIGICIGCAIYNICTARRAANSDESLRDEDQKTRTVAFSEFLKDVRDGRVSEVKITTRDTISEYEYEHVDTHGRRERKIAIGIVSERMTKDIIDRKVKVTYQLADEMNLRGSVLVTWIPMLFLLAMFFIFMRQIRAVGGKAKSFGKARVRLHNEASNKVTFEDVAGIEEAKNDCEEIVSFLKNPNKLLRLGAYIPKGVLLMGAPGTGKTLLARAIAEEAGVPFFCISGSDFVEIFAGVGASRVRDLFEQARKNKPCIIFIDEIDAIGRHRGTGLGEGNNEREQTLNQLLIEMDGFESNEGIIVVAATNRPDVLDPAILRPRRFDRRITILRPDVTGRLGILGVHTKQVPLASDVDLDILARGTPGFSGADIANLVNEAALIAARRDKDFVSMDDLETAKDRVLLGSERRSMIIGEKEKKRSAWHEAGHTVAGSLLANHEPVHKVSIIPRGPALGITMSIPKEDRLGFSKEWALDRIAMALGGRLAEELFLGEMTTGAADDFRQATKIARAMVVEWGMSKKLGPLAYPERKDATIPSAPVPHRGNYSEKTAHDIDAEVHRIVTEQYERLKRILLDNKDKIERVANALLEYETLDREEIVSIMAGCKLTVRDRVQIPTYTEKLCRVKKKEKEKRTGTVYQPKLHKVPSVRPVIREKEIGDKKTTIGAPVASLTDRDRT